MAFTVVATEDHVFGMDASDPSLYHVPGNGAPAVSTSSYYNLLGMYNMRPYDLDTMGSAGAAVKAAQGGKRYVWVTTADHPNQSYGWRGQDNTLLGFSHQPWDLPRSMYEIIPHHNSFSTPLHPTITDFKFYEFPYLFYNPDDPDGLPFYVFGETGSAHYTSVWRSSDLVTFTMKDISHFHTTGGGWSSFLSYARRNGPGDFTSLAYSTVGGGNGNPFIAIWTSTDGLNWTSANVSINGSSGVDPDSAGQAFTYSEIFTVAGQTYSVGKEWVAAGTGGSSQYGTIFPINATTFDKIDSPAKTRFTTKPFVLTLPAAGPTWLQEVSAYYEDGILYTWPTYGFPSDVNTTAQMAGHNGVPYNQGGGLDHQFLDKMVLRVDDTAAAQAAPVGVSVTCNAGVVTISWKDALPANTYRVERGTTAATQATLVGNVTGTSTTDSPTPAGRYWYKVTTIDAGTPRKSRVLPVYVSDASAFINQHVDRVLDDGGDPATINIPFLKRLDTMLTSVGIRNTLELLTHPAAGVKVTGSTLKIYDVGTTRLPRSDDFKTTTASTTYAATGINGGPCWINSTNSAYGYWGSLKRGNTLVRKRQITIVVAYTRTQTTEDFTFMGTGPVWGDVADGNKILKLTHKAGTPGSIEFSLSDATSTKTASVAATGSGLQVAVGTYDGTSMKAYSNTTAGTAVTTLDPNPEFGSSLKWVEGTLAGSRLNAVNGNNGDVVLVGGVGYKYVYPVLASGTTHCYSRRHQSLTGDDTIFTETQAKGSIQCVMVLEGAINSTQVASVVSFLNEQVNPTINSKNFVTDFGAVSDGQRQVVNASITSGGTTLTVASPIFAGGAAENGKMISINELPVTPSSLFLWGTITGSTTTTVTFTISASSNVKALSSVSTDIRWGTDNTAKLNGASGSWRAFARTQTDPAFTPVLVIPDGHYCINSNAVAGQGFNDGVLNPKWMGLSGNADACILSNLYTPGECRFGGDPPINTGTAGLDNTTANSVRLQTATAGQSTVTLVNAGTYGSRIIPNRWCLIGGFDTQSGGYPPNNLFYEWNYITAYAGGVVTLRNQLAQDYKSTWPEWASRMGVTDFGGPATLWVAPASFDNTVELNDFTLLAINGSSCHSQSVIMRRMKFVGFGIYPTTTRSWYADSCVYPQKLEIDKMVTTVTFDNCTLYRNEQQSSSPTRMTINGGTIDTLDTAKYTEVNNVAFTGTARISLGTFYGRTEQLVMNGCTSIAVVFDTTTPITTFTNWTWIGGKLRYLKSAGNTVGAFAPGTWIRFNSNKYIDRITDVTEDGTYIYIQFARTTDWPISPPTSMQPHPMPSMTVRGCTGTFVEMQDWNAAPAGWPLRSYARRTYVAGASTANLPGAEWPLVWGRPTSIKHTVGPGNLFTGGTTLGFKVNLSNNMSILKESDMSTVTNFGSFIDMKVAGTRTMINAGAATGSVGIDSQYNFTSAGSVWFYTAAFSSPGFTTSSASSTWVPVSNGDTPTVTVEFMMDQGIAAPTIETRDPIGGPIGLRLRG